MEHRGQQKMLSLRGCFSPSKFKGIYQQNHEFRSIYSHKYASDSYIMNSQPRLLFEKAFSHLQHVHRSSGASTKYRNWLPPPLKTLLHVTEEQHSARVYHVCLTPAAIRVWGSGRKEKLVQAGLISINRKQLSRPTKIYKQQQLF